MDLKTESQLRAEIEQVWKMLAYEREENKQLRLLLAIHTGGGLLYTDDGELQCNIEMPCIDFKRDTAEEIKGKLFERGLKVMRKEADGSNASST